MSKAANPGELRTPVTFMKISRETNENGYPEENEVNVFGDGQTVPVKWINAHGSDAFTAMQLQIREPATLTLRYSPLIKVDQLVYKVGDPDPYEIVSLDNVEERNTWLELKVQRKEASL